METKSCNYCNVSFPATSEYFYIAKRSKYGVASICKNCSREIYRKSYLQNPEKFKEKVKLWNKSNPEKYKEMGKAKRDRIKNSSELTAKKKESALKYYYKNFVKKENRKKRLINFSKQEIDIKHNLKKQIGFDPPKELIEVKLLILKTAKLCKTSKN